jgi:hypothetical protein
MTATKPRPRRRTDRPAGSPRMFLTIRDRLYEMRQVACDPHVGSRAFRLLSDSGDLYHVVQHDHGPTCDCPDFIFRRDGLDPDGCKHVRALVELRLIEPARLRGEPASRWALVGAE